MIKLPPKRTVGGCRATKINYDTRVVILKSQVVTKNSTFLVFWKGGKIYDSETTKFCKKRRFFVLYIL